VQIPTFSPPPRRDRRIQRTSFAARLEATGIVLSYICPLMYMNNPLSKKMPVITLIEQAAHYTSARFSGR
jgi:hypothetical protein